eukprot:CAMPEP_0174329890 /NCGR_PEP_ID=MMETSP0810-20121108/16223_1 /TAXON_ID=73025 ORGANISM="Eutreptiella gymnastica-like, Strain CCMP1594" /NCGR_SAMPLE_ID=MMETSP0810 /ASSEMBLY_ACC=CAM_ASM_000659 /LENGTH=34 /DNA_ID= /DNA_START= /DNA_END= /DNA_ORIENTATION=
MSRGVEWGKANIDRQTASATPSPRARGDAWRGSG